MSDDVAKTYAVGVPDNKPDPTANVLDLVKAESRRQDDLRKATEYHLIEIAKVEQKAIRREIKLRDDSNEKLREAEAKRIDAIRAVDVNAVAVAAERSAQQATVLANQVAASAETQRNLVATTAAALAEQLKQITTPILESIAQLQKSQYEGSGQRSVTDPQMTAVLAEVRAMSANQQQQTGSGVGVEKVIAYLALAATIAIALFVALKGG